MNQLQMPKRWSNAVRQCNSGEGYRVQTDNSHVMQLISQQFAKKTVSVPWAMQMRAISTEEPSRLVQTLTGAILGCGGWVLSRGANDSGTICLLFEFERHACVNIYSTLIAAGLELSQNGHIRFTELCQCTRSHQQECGSEIASVELEIQTFAADIKVDSKTGPEGEKGFTAES
jgi:hypothetical protein